MSFRNSILAGLTLIREAIRSQNYEPGVAGWSIEADGTAEFSDLTIRSSDGSGAVVEVENGKITLTAANGWKIILDPTNVLPIIYFRDASGDEMGSINASGVEDQAALVLASGPFTDGPVTDWRWAQIMGKNGTSDRMTIRRLRDEDESVFQGGFQFMSPTIAQYGMADSSDSTKNNIVHFQDHVAAFDGGRLVIGPAPENEPGIWLQLDAAHTGSMVRMDTGGATKVRVDNGGVATVYGGNTFETWTPEISGGGSATFDARDGWYQRIGKMIYVYATWSVGAAGSGTTALTMTLPVVPWRGTASRRQVLTGDASGVSPEGPISALVFAGGSGATLQRIQLSDGTDANGADLLAGSIWVLEGWLREA